MAKNPTVWEMLPSDRPITESDVWDALADIYGDDVSPDGDLAEWL